MARTSKTRPPAPASPPSARQPDLGSSAATKQPIRKKSKGPKVGPCRLLELPVELVEGIVRVIKWELDLRSFASTCQAFWKRWGKDWPMVTWKDPRKRDWSQPRIPLFRLDSDEDEEDQFGNLPFYIDKAAWDDELDDIKLNIVKVEPTHLIHEEGRSYLGQRFDRAEALTWADSDYLEWNSVRHDMHSASPEWLAIHFPCPTCRGKGTVSAGSKLLVERWPAMSRYGGNKRRQLDCPGCVDCDYQSIDDDGECLLDTLEDYDTADLDDYEL